MSDGEVLITVLFGNEGVIFSLLATFLAADDVVDACLTVDVVVVAGLAGDDAVLFTSLFGNDGVLLSLLAEDDVVVAGLAGDN